MSSKHRNSQSLPVGHPENIREQQMLQFNCNMCGFTSSLPYQLQNHTKEHTQAGGIKNTINENKEDVVLRWRELKKKNDNNSKRELEELEKTIAEE